MAKDIAKVTKWLLDQSPRIVKRLEKETSGIVLVGDSERLKLNKVRLLVPEGIVVYRAISEFRNIGEFFFSAREGKDTLPAYASYVTTEKDGGLNYGGEINLRNVGKLLEYTWFNNKDSSKIFDRLCHSNKRSNLYVADTVQQEGSHPFMKR